MSSHLCSVWACPSELKQRRVSFRPCAHRAILTMPCPGRADGLAQVTASPLWSSDILQPASPDCTLLRNAGPIKRSVPAGVPMGGMRRRVFPFPDTQSARADNVKTDQPAVGRKPLPMPADRTAKLAVHTPRNPWQVSTNDAKDTTGSGFEAVFVQYLGVIVEPCRQSAKGPQKDSSLWVVIGMPGVVNPAGATRRAWCNRQFHPFGFCCNVPWWSDQQTACVTNTRALGRAYEQR